MLGYADDDLENHLDTWSRLVHPADRDRVLALVQDYVAGRCNKFETEFRMRHRASHFITVLSRAFLSRNRQGKAVRLVGTHVDLTSLKKAEQELREQEELYRAMVDQAPDGVVLVDTETLGFKEFNDMACESLGYNREEFAGLTVFDINAEYSRDWHISRTQEILAQGHAVFETLHRHKDGSLRNMRISLRVVRIRGRQYFLGLWTDITEYVRLHEEMKLRENYQRALLDNFPYAVWMKNEVGQYLAVNRRLLNYLGLERPEDMVGRNNYDFLQSEHADRIAEEDRKVLMSGRSKHVEVRLPIRDEIRWFDVYQSPVTIDGRVIGTVGCNWDISERKVVEQELMESEERYRMLVELSPDSVFIHREGRFVFMNTTGALLLGAERPEDLYGREVLDFVHPEFREKVRQRIVTAHAHSKNPPIELVLLRTDEATVPVEMVSVHFRHRNVDLMLAVARDISERKRMQDELVKAQRLESLGVLAGGIAHDFNNILTGILGNISLLLHQLGPSSDFANRLESCEKAAIRASELTQQLLTFARGGVPVRKLMDPRTLIRESATFVLRGSQIGCEIELAEDLWSIKADAGQINQVLHNILINAMHAMPNGGVVGITGVNEQVSSGNLLHLPAGDYLRIDIKDQGCGIPQEDLPKIFDPYFSTKPEGTGLGLASVYSVVKKHGGAIDVSSTVGTGTIFTVFLPAVSGERPTETEAAGKNKLTGSGRILIMDDEQIIRDVATVILKSAGYHVESCTDGQEAVDRHRRRFGTVTAFDAVIMDLTVPGGMGGKEAARLILETDPNAVLIVSSGYSNDPVIANFRQYGFSGAVIKPFSVTTLVAEVQRLT
jgi:PAS domain S-box-containing protein